MKLRDIPNEPWFIPAVVGVTATVGGFAAGMVVGLKVGYRIRANEEEEGETVVITETIEEDQLTFEFDAKVDDLQNVDPKVTRLAPQVEPEVTVISSKPRRPQNDPNPRNDPRDITVDWEAIRLRKLEIEAEAREMVDNNVFDLDYKDWDYDEELPTRTTEVPYILHRDEFWGEEMGYDQSTLTYYAVDDILVDQEDTPIYNYVSITGPLRFGHGSGDENVVYVRNDKHEAEYEVLRHDSSYAEEILGVTALEDSEKDDLKHSVRKFRPRDD